ncbi:hypothetical protein ULF88_03095 [Halopseudomonas pachastrellae]|nr:hypothetical protein [Halopseudomonas pachastrellae]|tara:strand:- start:7968 stop:8171 length:204 start_codon:yes stop_codon:yes gene_type:complete
MSDEKMPNLQITLSDDQLELLEEVRRHQGLESVEQAAEWLAKTALRKAARRTSGRGRALYQVRSKDQ